MMTSRWVKSESVNDSSQVPKAGVSLRPRLEDARKRIESQLTRLIVLQSSLKERDEETLGRLIASIKENNVQYSTVLSQELSRARQTNRMVSIAIVALEKIHANLSAVTDFGDLVIVASPAMTVVKNVRSSLMPFVPEMEGELGVISELLSGVLVHAGQVGGYTINFETANEQAARIVEEASAAVENRMKGEFPGIPDLPMVPKGA